MYRSFLTCDDPKGVVECETIKRVKSSGRKTEDKTKNRRTTKNSDTCLPNKPNKQEMAPKGKVSSEKSHDQSCLQLMEVSREAERLNIMIDSWSGDLRHGGGSETIAKDLLKGALDLQESLVMLQKLQEASQDMARLKSKQNEKNETEKVRIDATFVDTTHAGKCSDQSYPMGFQRNRLSAHASSRNSTEELKEVIRSSLIRQNLLPSTSTEGLDSASEILSTSSSQSSLVHTDRLSDSSFSSTASKKEKGPNLFAKLMGLEQFPPIPFPASVQKQLVGEKILNQKRPTFEIDMPKVTKNNPMGRKKSLREIFETIHFKGMLKKSSVKEPKLQIHHLNHPHSKQYYDLPPIVLMKPRCWESVEAHSSVLPEQLSRRKLESEVVSSKTTKHKERYAKMSKKMDQKDLIKRRTQEKGPKELEKVKLKPIEQAPNRVKLNFHVSSQVKVSETIDQKAKVKIISRKLPDKELLKPRIVARSQGQGEITSIKKEISKPRIVRKSQNGGELTSSKHEISKPRIAARSQDEEENITTKLRKPQGGIRINKNDISCQGSIAPNTITKTKTQKVTNSKDKRKNQVKKQRSVAEPEADKPVVEQSGHEDEEKMIDVPSRDNCTEITTTTTVADELPVEHVVEVSVYNIGDYKPNQTSLGDVMLLNSGHEVDATLAEEDYDDNNCSKTNSKGGKHEDELKYLLLNSESFICHAEVLLNLDVDSTMILQKHDTNGIANLRLYLDCANELTERKSQKESQIVPPLLLACAVNSRLNITLGSLVEEIYNAIENLKLYREISGEKPSVNDLFAVMERDIQCNGLINGIWDWGWKHGFSADEAEQVVNDVENLVLSGLIEEVFA